MRCKSDQRLNQQYHYIKNKSQAFVKLKNCNFFLHSSIPRRRPWLASHSVSSIVQWKDQHFESHLKREGVKTQLDDIRWIHLFPPKIRSLVPHQQVLTVLPHLASRPFELCGEGRGKRLVTPPSRQLLLVPNPGEIVAKPIILSSQSHLYRRQTQRVGKWSVGVF